MEPTVHAPSDRSAPRSRWQQALSREELQGLLQIETAPGLRSLALCWLAIAACLLAVALVPHPLTVIGALFVIGARQLGLAILMHEAAHRTLLPDPTWNDRVGKWLAAYPIWADLGPYRRYHLRHHAHTGGPGDPDLGLIAPFPITRASFARKVVRDLSGWTGLRQTVALLSSDLGLARRRTRRSQGLEPGQQPDVGWHNLAPVALTNGALLGVLWLLGYPELYLLWVGAWLSTYRLCTRIRSIAEHALTPDPSDPLNNTRTTRARWWERLLIAPNFVNYHLEHHLLMTVPHYKLPRLHALLRERGVLDRACVAPGYLHVLAQATSAPRR